MAILSVNIDKLSHKNEEAKVIPIVEEVKPVIQIEAVGPGSNPLKTAIENVVMKTLLMKE